ncbi:YeeE/YedE family protein [Hymenobacter sp. J193]|uniref:YeeE/YedE family protein n=1 Tax=Hymenobacter sp. J193 TaxID=2898429 RepID=UPI002150FC44|nr:YeeE/YedE family protein [Hymenobacter sp. J193]MCR5889163.1 YeeE/YedE family protein [Hymenobacter sp. J193]
MPPAVSAAPARTRLAALAVYFAVGLVFGVLITKGELISWFRIQEMFRFRGFHMYGIFLTALPTAILTVQWLKRSQARTLGGAPISIPPKQMGRGVRYVVGGVCFGLGWALTGACPGPLFALLGSGVPTIGVAIGAALVGTWTYAWLRPRLPH